MTTTIVPASLQAGRALAATVSELEIRLTGGTPFFNALDERLRDPYWFRALLNKAHELYGYDFHIALSGEFGRKFERWAMDAEGASGHRTIVFPGDLRHTILHPDFLARYYRALNRVNLIDITYVFLDDSYYKGRTFGQIKNAIQNSGGTIDHAVVLYDGSLDAPVVPSLFRYHAPNSTRIPV